MPAVDSPEPDGLSFDRLGRLLSGLAQHPKAMGMDVCLFDPDLDPDGRHATALARMLNDVLGSI